MSRTRIAALVNIYAACRAPLFAVLQDLPAEQLNWKPAPDSRSIGEICRHLIRVDAWFLRRLGVEPVVADAASGQGEEIAAHLEQMQQQVLALVAACREDQDLLLERTALDGTGQEAPGVAALHMAQHYLYHLAQIVYLRRAQDRNWPAPLQAWETATHVIGDYLLGRRS